LSVAFSSTTYRLFIICQSADITGCQLCGIKV
jgi:hypothetical protein